MFLHALNWAIVPERDVTIPTEKIKKREKERGIQIEKTGKQ